MAMTDDDRAAGPDAPRDPVIDRAYAAGAQEEPPARLDAAILAAARREVGARPQRLASVLRPWRGPVALAAVLVLSVSVVLLLREEGADRLDQVPSSVVPPAADDTRLREQAASARRESEPGPARSADAPAPAPELPPTQARELPASPPKAGEEDRRKVEGPSELRNEAPPPAAAARPAPRPFAEAPAAAELRRAAPEAAQPQTGSPAKEMEPSAAAGARDRAPAVERDMQAQQAPAPPPLAASETRAFGRLQGQAQPGLPDGANRAEEKLRKDGEGGSQPVWHGFERQPPEKWLERVDELRRAGRNDEARDMLLEFRKRFPQHPVPPALDR